MLTEEIRNNTYSNASPVQQHLYSSGDAGHQLLEIAKSANLTDQGLYRTFAITVGDIILGFYNVEDTEPLLMQELGISAEVAKPLAADVQEFLAPLNDPNWQPPAEPEETAADVDVAEAPQPDIPENTSAQGEEDVSSVSTPPARPMVASPTTTAKPSAPEDTAQPTTNSSQPNPASSESTPGIRTMAHDMAESQSAETDFTPLADTNEPTHSSSQADIQTPVATAHSDTKPTPPRWSEN